MVSRRFFERPDAADAEDDLLLHAVFDVAAVEVLGDVAVVAVVFGEVCIEEVEGDAADVCLPDPDCDCAAGEFDGHTELFAGGGVDESFDRLVWEVEVGVGFLLPAVCVEVLVEESAAVEEPHAAEGEAEFRSALEVVACEEAQPARVDLETLGEPEFGGEIRDTVRAGFPGGVGEVFL